MKYNYFYLFIYIICTLSKQRLLRIPVRTVKSYEVTSRETWEDNNVTAELQPVLRAHSPSVEFCFG